jgi:Putative DNA-binding domain
MKAPSTAIAPAPAPAPTLASSKEALRQQTLLAVLWGDAPADAVWPWLQGGPLHDGRLRDRGLAAYRANAAEIAERALAAAYPVVQQLLGEESFAALARALWRHQPPQAGDLALWGDGLAHFLSNAAARARAPDALDVSDAPDALDVSDAPDALGVSDAPVALDVSDATDVPYLCDMARLEWALHLAARAADATPVQGLQLLGESDPAQLFLQLAPGTALVQSQHPVFSIWWAHQSAGPAAQDRHLADARAALAVGVAQSVLVQRQGWKPELRLLTIQETRFAGAVLAGRPLGSALDEAGADFGFEAWLIGAVQRQLLVAVHLAQTLQAMFRPTTRVQESAQCLTLPPFAS